MTYIHEKKRTIKLFIKKVDTFYVHVHVVKTRFHDQYVIGCAKRLTYQTMFYIKKICLYYANSELTGKYMIWHGADLLCFLCFRRLTMSIFYVYIMFVNSSCSVV